MGLNQISRNMCQFLIDGNSQYFFNFATVWTTKIEQSILKLKNRELPLMEGSGSLVGFTLWYSVNAYSNTWRSTRTIFRKNLYVLWRRECRNDWRNKTNRQFRNDVPRTITILSIQNPRFWKISESGFEGYDQRGQVGVKLNPSAAGSGTGFDGVWRGSIRCISSSTSIHVS